MAEVLMVAGALIWLVGELGAVFLGKRFGEPTTWWVRHWQREWPIVRVIVVVFLLGLVAHFEVGFLGVRWQGPL